MTTSVLDRPVWNALSTRQVEFAIGGEHARCFAPDIGSAEEALAFIMKSGESAGFRPGTDFVLGLDVAATEFFKDGKYVMAGEGKSLDAAGMVDYLAALAAKFPIVSIEEPKGPGTPPDRRPHPRLRYPGAGAFARSTCASFQRSRCPDVAGW